MLGIQHHPSSHSSFSLEISRSLSSSQHMNTDWAFFTEPLMRVESEQTTGIRLFCVFFWRRAWSILHKREQQLRKTEITVYSLEIKKVSFFPVW